MKMKLIILSILLILPILVFGRGLYVDDLVTNTGTEIVLGNDTKENELLVFSSYYGFDQLNFLTLDSNFESWGFEIENYGLLKILINGSRMEQSQLVNFLEKARKEYGIETFGICVSHWFIINSDINILDRIDIFTDENGNPYFTKIILEQDINEDTTLDDYYESISEMVNHQFESNYNYTFSAYLGFIPVDPENNITQESVISNISSIGLDEIYPSFYSPSPSEIGYVQQLEKLELVREYFDDSKIFPIFSAQDNFMGDYFDENQSVETNCFELTEIVFEEYINTQQGFNNAEFSWYNIFSTQYLFDRPNLTEVKEINTNKYNWLAFPRYNDSNNNLGNVLEDLTINNDIESAKAISQNNNSSEYYAGSWSLNYDIEPETFYKIKASSEDEKLFFWVGGDQVYDQEIEIPLYEHSFTTKWIGYWKKEPQTLKDAFSNDNGEYNETWEFIESVSSEDSYYSKNHTIRGSDVQQAYSSNPENIILEYGKGYKVTFLPTSYTNHHDIASIDFEWGSETNTFDYRKKKATTYFIYNAKPEYIAIDIVEFDDIDEVEEIGVFADGKCIGATVADSLPLQVLIYPDIVNKANQGFELRTVNNNRSEVIQKYSVYDDKVNSFTSKPLTNGKEIYYVKVKKNNDHFINESSSITAMNYPNPFNPSTTIRFTIHKNSKVKLEIYNLIGQKIKTIKEGYLAEGNHSYTWNGKNNRDEEVSSGIYFYKISTNDNSVQSKILLIK